MIILGLTGSIGMGKTTVATMMKNLGIPVHDADAAVHGFYKTHQLLLCATFPYFDYPQLYNRKTKTIMRAELGKLVFEKPELRVKLEEILHPLVRKSQIDFIRNAANKKREIICLDIPLLFETGAQNRVDYTIVVTAPPFIQRARVLARPNMNEEKFNAVLKTQMTDTEKRTRADFILHTGAGRAHTLRELKEILADIKQQNR